MLSQSKLKELLHYSKSTGLFTWIVGRQCTKAGAKAGTKTKDGYIRIKIKGKSYLAHILSFLYIKGYIPEHQVDHKNGVCYDNKWKNLRHVTQQCNSQNSKIQTNNSSGFTGVRAHKGTNKWRASIQINGNSVSLGLHETVVDAALARVSFEDQCDKWSCDHRNCNRVKLRKLGFKV